MLTGRQLRLLRLKKNIGLAEIAGLMGISSNRIVIYENELEQVPESLYDLWIKIIKERQADDDGI